MTRSLADFAKLVELFDAHSVSFVSVTQQFNTSTSMGRLTLNVLLSFAQFEREVTSERIRDKIAASKRKGLWVGGMAPLGYDTRDRKISVNEAEAEQVRSIFSSYLRLGSLNLLMADLREQGIVTKVRTLKTGKRVGGIPFTRGPLAYLLRNRFYIGEVAFKGEVLKGEQPPIIDRALFDAVQAKLNEQATNHKTSRMQSEAVLAGRIFDDRGNRMSPTHARKGGVRYRYYLSSALLQGTAERAGSVRRAPAAQIEALVAKSVRDRLALSEPMDDRAIIERHVARVEVQRERLIVQLAGADAVHRECAIEIPWQKATGKRRREILAPEGIPPRHARPIRSDLSLQELTRRIRHHTISDQVGEINAFLRGHYAYYGVAGNLRCLVKVYRAVERYWHRMLRSRSWAGRWFEGGDAGAASSPAIRVSKIASISLLLI